MVEKDQNRLFGFGVMIGIVVVILINADKLWDAMDTKLAPYVSYDSTDEGAIAGAGSVEANAIKNLHIDWGYGNVSISYAPQQRITWKETFTEGEPSQYNTLSYWMNTQTLFIHFYSHEYNANQPTNDAVSKDLQVRLPEGCQLNKIFVRNTSGVVQCDVKANVIDTKTLN